ncbi:hypothetical protein J6590_006374 [Homalodisca vitripennis]|nr:hypothetical protein J6590_006374 [Homalodisca vitripennis]
MERQVDAGRAKYIGLSNFNVNQIKRVMKTARIPPSNLQIELNLFLQSKEEQEFCRKHGITITSYATLGSPGVPQGFFIGAYENPLKDPLVEKLALVYQKTPAQVLLRHVVQLGVAVIPKSANPLRLKENLDIFDFELTDAEMCQLNALDRGEAARKFVLQVYSTHPENPYPSTRVQHK